MEAPGASTNNFYLFFPRYNVRYAQQACQSEHQLKARSRLRSRSRSRNRRRRNTRSRSRSRSHDRRRIIHVIRNSHISRVRTLSQVHERVIDTSIFDDKFSRIKLKLWKAGVVKIYNLEVAELPKVNSYQ